MAKERKPSGAVWRASVQAVVAGDAPALGQPRGRVGSVDILRGIVMIVMALDHVRDFVSDSPFNPESADHAPPALFFTRWITHFCAPTFFLLAGMGAGLSPRPRGELARFLVGRGLWLIFLEFTVVHFAWMFDLVPVRLLVLWALGASMLALAGLQFLPRRVLWIIAIAVIAGHNLLDPVEVAFIGRDYGRPAVQLWSILHVPIAPVLYPLVPWFAVMLLGYLLAPALRHPRALVVVGVAVTAAFVVLRATNLYGDPDRFSGPHVLLSFLATNKYPPSLLFLLMTLGPAMASLPLLASLDGTALGGFLAVYGRVPLFFYVVHIYLAHLAGVLLGEHGLPVVYGVWLLVVAILYLPCRWFADLKARRRDLSWLSYL